MRSARTLVRPAPYFEGLDRAGRSIRDHPMASRSSTSKTGRKTTWLMRLAEPGVRCEHAGPCSASARLSWVGRRYLAIALHLERRKLFPSLLATATSS